MNREAIDGWMKKLGPIWKKYKFVLLIVVVGAILLLLPSGETAQEQDTAAAEDAVAAEDDFSVATMERKLEQTLSRIEGAGEVDVLLTVKSGARQILAQDGKTTERNGEVDSTISTVVISGSDRTEETVALQQLSPQYQGALVVCPGGEDPAVQLRLSEAISALTGLGMDRISICKGK